MSNNQRPLRTAVYPGTFDPITCGHVDIISRAAGICDKLIIGVAANAGKSPLFSLQDRVSLVRGELDKITAEVKPTQLDVQGFDNLLVQFCRDVGATILLRGLRAVSDFEYEFQMAAMNRRIAPDIETVFLMASDHNHFVSSRFVKEIAELGGDVSSFVSESVQRALKQAE